MKNFFCPSFYAENYKRENEPDDGKKKTNHPDHNHEAAK
jgi:hypothetical protein